MDSRYYSENKKKEWRKRGERREREREDGHDGTKKEGAHVETSSLYTTTCGCAGDGRWMGGEGHICECGPTTTTTTTPPCSPRLAEQKITREEIDVEEIERREEKREKDRFSSGAFSPPCVGEERQGGQEQGEER
jgi:hypothetical protein